jgi:hypothetical protein
MKTSFPSSIKIGGRGFEEPCSKGLNSGILLDRILLLEM